MATVAQKQRLFLSSPQFAVVGASKDQSKFGTKVRYPFFLHVPLQRLMHDMYQGSEVVSNPRQKSNTDSSCERSYLIYWRRPIW